MLCYISDLVGDWELVAIAGFTVTVITFLALHWVHRHDCFLWRQDDRDPSDTRRQRDR
jgi:hypothetical protein